MNTVFRLGYTVNLKENYPLSLNRHTQIQLLALIQLVRKKDTLIRPTSENYIKYLPAQFFVFAYNGTNPY